MTMPSKLGSRGGHAIARNKQKIAAVVLSPLHLPEILSIIFSFLSQHTLKHSIRFVCKRWLAVARPLIRVTMLWKYWFHPNNTRDLLDHIHKVTDLNIDFVRFYGIHWIIPPWELLSKKIDSLSATNQLHISSLVLTGANYSAQLIYPLLPKLTNLSDFRMVSMEEGVIHLGIILQLCPKLHFLSIERPEGANQIEDNSITSGQDSDPEFRESKIEYLIINGVYIGQSTLETIIRRCPQLRVLKLINIALQESSAGPFDRNAFNEVVATSCQQLRYFHLSICHQRITLEQAEAFYRTFFPDVDTSGSNLSGYEDHAHRPYQKTPTYNLNTVSVQDIDINQDTTPFILAPLLDRYLRNTVTTLEIINTGDELFTVYLSDLLHNFMCTATCLLHLIAPAINYYAEYFDLSEPSAGTGHYYPRSSTLRPKSPRLKKQIWACHRLRTLQIKVTSKDLMDNPSENNSRIMFGYISLVCPNLRELVIDRAQLNLGLEGGFCFLSRLHSLERLTVSTRTLTTLDRRDLEWMSKKPTMNFKLRQRSDSTALYRELADLQVVGPIEKLYSCHEQHSDGMGEQDCWPILEFLSLNFRLLWKGKTATLEDYLPAMISEIRPGLEIHCKGSGLS